ncbi:hypothetical protein [Enterococcus xiangfangensis]|uniref:hypothetical protein n=1 Tax=Enterococcus xiangfangensis TaxID=1296537 RepID=UPI003D180554
MCKCSPEFGLYTRKIDILGTLTTFGVAFGAALAELAFTVKALAFFTVVVVLLF